MTGYADPRRNARTDLGITFGLRTQVWRPEDPDTAGQDNERLNCEQSHCGSSNLIEPQSCRTRSRADKSAEEGEPGSAPG
jgi:hypothetical protein